MKCYTNEVINIIESQLNDNQINIMRIEGIDTPIIYKAICEHFRDNRKEIIFEAKLSREKHAQFLQEHEEKWKNSLEYMLNNNFIDTKGAMTRWRNEAAQKYSDNANKVVVLLMGTEMVQDTGGLADFYRIIPDDIINSLGKNYFKWFKHIFEKNSLKEEEYKAINTLYRAIFKNINVDLQNLSNFVDSLDDFTFPATQDLITYICETLSDNWKIPCIRTIKYIPKVRNLIDGKNSTKVIEEAYKFINRKEDYSTASKLNSVRTKLEKYVDSHDILVDRPFPEEVNIFESFDDFRAKLIDFLLGKNVAANRKLFMRIDFAIIHEILGIRIRGPKTTKMPAISGEPLEAFTEILLTSIREFIKEYGSCPNDVSIRIDEIRLSNCVDDEENKDSTDSIDAAFTNVCCFMGGLVNFINSIGITTPNGELIKLNYIYDYDPFVPANIENTKKIISLRATTNFNELCKIGITIIAKNDLIEEDKYSYKWKFSPQNSWKNSFSILNSFVNEQTITHNIPVFISCDNIGDYIACENEEEFNTKVEQIKLKNTFKDSMNTIKSQFSTETLGQFNTLLISFTDWAELLCERGLFNSFQNLDKFVEKYTYFIQGINDNYSMFSSLQKEHLHLFLNSFILSGNLKFVPTGEVTNALVPPHHPVMLEKIVAKMVFLKQGLIEMLLSIYSNSMDKKDIKAKLEKFMELSTVTSATDIIKSKTKYLMCQTVWGYFGVYFEDSNIGTIMSGGGYSGNIIDDDNEDKTAILKVSPESNIIRRNILDYIRVFPARSDGLNICFVASANIQHIVAGVHGVVKELDKRTSPSVINVRIISFDKRKNAAGYLRFWLDNYFGEESKVRVSTYLKYMSLESADTQSMDKILKNQDLCFVYNILTQLQISFRKVPQQETNYDESKFPMSFIPDTISQSQGKRSISISQFQFAASKAHTQLSHTIGNPNDEKGVYKVVRPVFIEDKQMSIVDKAHTYCKWIVCIDEAIDRYLLQSEKRKIIGFTTGEGCFGELNVTVSSREDILKDIKGRLKKRIVDIFRNWSNNRIDSSADFCVDITKDMDGSRILRALNPYDYEIHNYLAYVLTLQMLRLTENSSDYFVRNLINLDSHKHWFNNVLSEDENASRPDFLLIEIPNIARNSDATSKVKIRITVVECKMGMKNQSHIENAKEQLEHGIKVLFANWSPDNCSISKRYWFNQLYRAIIFSPLNLMDNDSKYSMVSEKILGILNGNFEVEWQGEVFAFWLDEEGDTLSEYSMNSNLYEAGLNLCGLNCHIGGQQFIQKMLVPNENRDDRFDYNDIAYEEDEDEDEDKDNSKPVIKVLPTTPTPNPTPAAPIIEPKPLEKPLLDTTPIAPPHESNIKPLQDVIPSQENTKKDIRQIRLLLGEDMKTGEKMYWEYGDKELSNRHLLINGNSGCGKTYCIQALLLELAVQGVSSVIFDYTDGFTTSKLDPLFVNVLNDRMVQRYVRRQKFPVSPFKKQDILLGDEYFPEEDVDIAIKISNIFASVYKFGDQQRSAIYSAVLSGVRAYGENMSFRHMADELEEIGNNYATTVLSKIRPFIDIDPFAKDEQFDWSEIRDSEGKVFVIQLTGYDRSIQLLLTEIILWDIWNYCVKNGDESKPFTIVLDEAQNISHGESSPSGKILTEGRKFGVSGWYATQFMKPQLSDDEIQRLQQAVQKLYFCPPDDGVMTVAKNIDINTQGSKDWAERLKKLKKGECVTCGSMNRKGIFNKYEPRIIKVTSLGDRLNGSE